MTNATNLEAARTAFERHEWAAAVRAFAAAEVPGALSPGDLGKAGQAIGAATEAGANVLSGTNLDVADPEASPP